MECDVRLVFDSKSDPDGVDRDTLSRRERGQHLAREAHHGRGVLADNRANPPSGGAVEHLRAIPDAREYLQGVICRRLRMRDRGTDLQVVGHPAARSLAYPRTDE